MESTKRETGIRLQEERDFFTSTTPIQTLGATRSVSDWYGRLFPRGYEIGDEGDYSIPSTTEVENTWVSLFMVY